MGQPPVVDLPHFRPSSVDDLAPSGAKGRAIANLVSIDLVRRLDAEGRAATESEQAQLARFGSWGAIPEIFDEAKPQWTRERDRLKELLTDTEYAAASRTTINAHYTDPVIASAMWDTVTELGFDGGDVLEPGCGSGHFIGLAPTGARMVGVELDPISAKVASYLYPSAVIRAESFADTRLPDGTFDVAIGNVPFANVSLSDPRHNLAGHSMHNHFLVKSVALTRPGGLIVALTSRYTLDAQNPSARRAIHDQADLLGAIRLPTGAHQRMAGTQAVTDLLILRKRPEGQRPRDDAWVSTTPRIIDGEKVRINTYFDVNPDKILGELSLGHGMHGSTTVNVVPREGALTNLDLRQQLSAITAAATHTGHTLTERTTDTVDVRAAAAVGDGKWDGHIDALDDGTFTVMTDGIAVPTKIPASQATEARALLRLRDQTRALLEAEADRFVDSGDIEAMRATLARTYGQYSARYGPINRFTLHETKRTNPETGEPAMTRRVPTVMSRLRKDPFFPLVGALEVFDDDTHTAEPAALLNHRVVVPREPALGADTPADALAICLDTTGRADLDTVARLLGVEAIEAREQLGQLVFDDPITGAIVPAAEYVSGNVRDKLDAARHAAGTDPRFAPNVTALTEVLPKPLGADEIEAQLGAVWIPPDDVRQFLVDLLDDKAIKVEHPGGNVWHVKGNNYSAAATAEWGTERVAAARIAQYLLEQRTPTVSDTDADGKSIPNITETVAAQEKAAIMQARFGEWLWEDPERTIRLVDEYNRRFNSIVLRDYSQDGRRLTLPGMAATIQLRDHQRTAVARMIAEPAVLLAHAVGAGKTLEAAAGITELKRLGLVNKPVVVVPNHMLAQFSREWLAAYPAARILAASSKDLAKEHRRGFVARVATHDWDAIILTRTAFERLELSPQARADYLERESASLRAMLSAAKDSETRMTVKRVEKALQVQEEKIKKALAGPKDPGISFELTGIDYVLVDEQHDYKNLETASNVFQIQGSGRARDLHMKLDYLRTEHGGRVATFMTATPIANSVAEAHVMCRYLRPDLLRDAGVEHFDSWAATFGQVVNEIEMDPSGTTFRQKARFARFQNVPEMLRMWHTFADVKTHEDLNLPVPLVAARADGQRVPQTVLVDPSPQLQKYVESLGERAERVRARVVDSREDNMLKISGDGRRAALDMRLVDPQWVPDGSATKVEVAADRITAIWQQNRDNEYLDTTTGTPSPVPGAAQLVFCDQSTPNPERWDVYHELKHQLVQRGMPADAVRFIHDARNDQEKAQLFAAVRSGHVAVLLGSTGKMGTGTNVQARLIASHHLDAPWRPADVEQQIGRSIRQGNQNPEVQVLRYITEGSFDSYSWQTLERKAKFIAQVTRGSLDVRDIEDIGDTALSFGEVKALASGDPMVMEKAKADNDLARLERLQRAFNRSASSLHQQIETRNDTVSRISDQIPLLEAAIEKTTSTQGDAFTMRIGQHVTSERSQAAELLANWTRRHVSTYASVGRDLGTVAELGGHQINARVVPGTLGVLPAVAFTVADVPRSSITIDVADLHAAGTGPILKLEHRIQGLPKIVDDLREQRAAETQAIDECRAALQRPFTHAAALTTARTLVADIDAQMKARATPENATPGSDAQPTDSSTPAANEAATETSGTKAAREAFPRPLTVQSVQQAATNNPASEVDLTAATHQDEKTTRRK